MTQPTPSQLFSPRQLATKALELVGAYTPNDDAPDENELTRALEWMEIELAELAGTRRCQWLIPETIEFPLEANEPSYRFRDVAGGVLSGLLMMYPIEAWVLDSSGNATPVTLIRRKEYEDKTDKTASGTPSEVYIDRLNDDPNIAVYPVPSDGTLSLRLVIQTYTRTVLAHIQVAANEDGSDAHGFDRVWQKWIAHQTAATVGNGPVRQLRETKLKSLQAIADRSLVLIEGSFNREKVAARVRRTRRYGG